MNFYKSMLFILFFLNSIVYADITVDKTVTMMQGEHKQNELMELLLQKAKREAASEIYGDYVESNTKIENGRLSSDSILALVVGTIHVQGTPKYANGENFGEVQVSITAYATDAEIQKAKTVLDKRVQVLQKAENETPEIVSNQFTAVIKTSKGGKKDIFYEGEEVELYVLLNQPGYYYIEGEMSLEGERKHYLVDLDDSSGMDKFVRYVNAENTNKWISLGAFEVEAPFGSENLIIIASNKPFQYLPRHYYDDATGYYIVSQENKSRGLKKKNKSSVKHSKNSLHFTTMSKKNQ